MAMVKLQEILIYLQTNQKILWSKLKPNLIIDECKITEINSLKKKKFSYNVIIFNKIIENQNLKYILNILSLLDKKGTQEFLQIRFAFNDMSYQNGGGAPQCNLLKGPASSSMFI